MITSKTKTVDYSNVLLKLIIKITIQFLF